MNWIKKALSEPDGTPSSQRVMLLIMLVFTLDLLACAFYQTGGLPDVPASLADIIKWMFSAIIGGIGVGKIAGAINNGKGE